MSCVHQTTFGIHFSPFTMGLLVIYVRAAGLVTVTLSKSSLWPEFLLLIKDNVVTDEIILQTFDVCFLMAAHSVAAR